MSHTSVEERIRELEQRLAEAERRPVHRLASYFHVSLKTTEDRARFFGWGIATFSILGLLASRVSSIPAATIFFACSLVLGIVLIALASGFIGHSDSYLQLAQEERAGKHVKAHEIHARHTTRTGQPWASTKPEHWLVAAGFLILAFLLGWSFVVSVAEPYLQVLPIALVLTLLASWGAIYHRRSLSLVSIIALTALLFVTTNPIIALMAALAGFGAIWMSAWQGKDIDLLSWSGFGLTGVAFGQVYWGFTRFSEAELVAASSAAFMGLILASAPYAVSRRELHRRDFSRFAITVTPIVTLATLSAAGPYTPMQNLLAGLALVAVGYGGMGYVGWLSHGRMSYAKYFLTAALGATLLFVYLALDPVSVALIWFTLGIIATAAGFTLPSYSARLVGLMLILVSVLHYLLTVMPATQIAGPILLRDRVWVGALMAIFLPALALWYREATLKGVEQRLVIPISTVLSSIAYLLLVGIVILDISSPYQSIVLLAVGGAALFYGRFMYLRPVSYLGFFIAIFGMLHLLFIDMMSLESGNRLLLLLIASLFLIVLGITLPKRQSS